MTYSHASDFEKAVDFLKRGIRQSGREEPHLRKAYGLLVYAQMKLGRQSEALASCREGREMFPRDTELRFREGVLLHDLGRFHDSRQAYLDVLNGNGDERHLASVDRGLKGFRARQNLAVLASDMGDLAEAERQWREVVREVPGYRQGWPGLADAISRQGRLNEAERLADELIKTPELRTEGYLIKSRTAVTLGRIADARAALDRAVAEKPDDIEALRARAPFFFDHGSLAEAEQAIGALITRAPSDASAHHNLGTLMMRAQRFPEAVEAYERSYRFVPIMRPRT